MRDWPRIDEPLLLERLGLDDAGFLAWAARLTAALGERESTPALVERALAYPWARPARSYLLRDDVVDALDDLAPGARQAAVASFRGDPARHPLLAIGSNGAPGTLTAKFAHLPPADRHLLVEAGALHDFDVGVAAQPTAYGALPATLFASPGTAVRVAVLWVTDAQFTQLAWSEMSYRLGRLEGVRFTGDDGEGDNDVPDGLMAFVSRFGVFSPDGEAAALAAIPARGRRAPALTQEALLDRAARIALGSGARAEDLVRAIYADLAGFGERTGDAIRRCSRPFASAHWRPYPGAPS